MRKLAFLTLFLGVWAAAQEPTHPGTERWAIKTTVPDGTNFSKPATIPLADLLAMPDAPNVKHNDPSYETARIPAGAGAKYKEGDLLTTTRLAVPGGRGDRRRLSHSNQRLGAIRRSLR